MTSVDNSSDTIIPEGQAKDWNWNPNLPIPTSPMFSWPPHPIAALRWLSSYWLALSPVVLELALAIAIYVWFLSAFGEMKSVSFGWIAQTYVRNLILMTAVAGGLHLYFYSFSAQEKKLKYDARDLARGNRAFTFNNQVLDNMFWTLASGVTVWTSFEVLYFWSAANGLAPLLSFAEAPVWFVAWLVIIPIWSSLHFYWVHRVLHWPPLYKLAHALHHRNINVGPWTGISMHPLEHMLYFSSVLIHFIVPSHPVHVLFHLYVQALNPAFSHSGFDALLFKNKKLVDAGDFFHQLHHRFFECNYGTAEMPWDKWFGSFHNGTPEANQRVKERRKRFMSS